MVKLSIIMYVFNSEQFLKDSLDSLLNQSLDNIEIICVNDESTDNSLKILNKYSKNENIKVITLNHSGYSKAINETIDKTQGKYSYILTPECVLEKDAMNLLYQKSEELGTDLIISNSNYYDEINKKTLDNESFFKNIDTKNILDKFNFKNLNELIFEIDTNISNILFNTKFIKDNEIKFCEKVIYGDEIFFYQSLLSASKINFFKDKLFTHRIYSTNLTKRNDSYLLDTIINENMIIDVFREKNELENYEKWIYEHKMNHIIEGFNKINEEYKNEYYQGLKQDFITILDDDKVCMKFIDNISDHNRKIFEQILISENIYEYDLLRKTYYEMIEYYKLLEDKKYLEPLATEYED